MTSSGPDSQARCQQLNHQGLLQATTEPGCGSPPWWPCWNGCREADRRPALASADGRDFCRETRKGDIREMGPRLALVLTLLCLCARGATGGGRFRDIHALGRPLAKSCCLQIRGGREVGGLADGGVPPTELILLPGALELAGNIRDMIKHDDEMVVLFSKLERCAYYPPTDEEGRKIQSGYMDRVADLEYKLIKHGNDLISLSKKLMGRNEAASKIVWQIRKLEIEKLVRLKKFHVHINVNFEDAWFRNDLSDIMQKEFLERKEKLKTKLMNVSEKLKFSKRWLGALADRLATGGDAQLGQDLGEAEVIAEGDAGDEQGEEPIDDDWLKHAPEELRNITPWRGDPDLLPSDDDEDVGTTCPPAPAGVKKAAEVRFEGPEPPPAGHEGVSSVDHRELLKVVREAAQTEAAAAEEEEDGRADSKGGKTGPTQDNGEACQAQRGLHWQVAKNLMNRFNEMRERGETPTVEEMTSMLEALRLKSEEAVASGKDAAKAFEIQEQLKRMRDQLCSQSLENREDIRGRFGDEED